MATMVSTAMASRFFLLSPPLWGRVGEGGSREHGACCSPPSQTSRASFARLGPHKGGGNREGKPGHDELKEFL
jgi:hypothetical protein